MRKKSILMSLSLKVSKFFLYSTFTMILNLKNWTLLNCYKIINNDLKKNKTSILFSLIIFLLELFTSIFFRDIFSSSSFSCNNLQSLFFDFVIVFSVSLVFFSSSWCLLSSLFSSFVSLSFLNLSFCSWFSCRMLLPNLGSTFSIIHAIL